MWKLSLLIIFAVSQVPSQSKSNYIVLFLFFIWLLYGQIEKREDVERVNCWLQLIFLVLFIPNQNTWLRSMIPILLTYIRQQTANENSSKCIDFLMVLANHCSNHYLYFPQYTVPILQNNHHPVNRPHTTFYHPLMQTQIMIIAEMLCIIFFIMDKNERKEGDKRPRVPIHICFLPMAMDLIVNSLEMVAFNYLSGSVFSIVSIVVILSTAFFTKILLRKTFTCSQIAGCLFAVAGVVLTGLAEILDQDGSENSNIILGLVLTIIANLILGCQTVIVQIIFTKYHVTPNEFVGISGIAGTIFWTLMMILFSFLGCPFPAQHCVEDYSGNFHLEHIPTFFQDLSGDAFLIVILIVNMLIIARWNFDVNRLIMVTDAMVYQIVSTFGNLLIWIVGIIITLLANGNEEFTIESLNFQQIVIKLAGFTLATIGLMLYNQLLFKKRKHQESTILSQRSAIAQNESIAKLIEK